MSPAHLSAKPFSLRLRDHCVGQAVLFSYCGDLSRIRGEQLAECWKHLSFSARHLVVTAELAANPEDIQNKVINDRLEKCNYKVQLHFAVPCSSLI